jgi:formamidopyrimidine-DNA glycosylase
MESGACERKRSMPELPESHVFAYDMQTELVGRTIGDVEVQQSKCLNMPEDACRAAVTRAQILGANPHGKWLKLKTDRGWLLRIVGIGGEILLTAGDRLPEKVRLICDLADGCPAENAHRSEERVGIPCDRIIA